MSISPNPSLKTFLRITWNSKQLNLNFQSVSHLRQSVKRTPVLTQSYGFSSSHIQMWELDHKKGWTPKNLCFQTVALEKTFESPWIARRSNQSILKEIDPKHSLEGLMLKLKLQLFGPLMWRAGPLEKTLMLGKVEVRRRRRRQRVRWLDGITDSMDMT